MISVDGRRFGRKGLGLGFGGGGGVGGGGGGGEKMDELEEGEACDYHDGGDDDANIDPDVDFSYLDEKVQNVLGHLQKDFEGGVSAENLGAKFGGYGSFLPTYQRSPSIWSQPRTPQIVQSYGTPKSPSTLPPAPLEGACQNSAVPSSITPALKLGPASTNAAHPPVSRASFVDTSSRRELYPSSLNSSGGEFATKHDSDIKTVTSSDQKSLKVRIKVGLDKASQKAAAIFSGLGLDASSSPDESPVENGGKSPKCRLSSNKSPTSILEVMSSSPVPGEILLSPIPDSLLHLMKREKPVRVNKSSLACKGSKGGSSILEEPSSVTGEGGQFGGKKMKQLANRDRLLEVNNRVVKDENNISVLLKKEVDIETAEGKEIVSNSLKLPLLYDSNCSLGDLVKDIGRTTDVSGQAKKGRTKEKFFPPEFSREEILESVISQDSKRVEKLKTKTSAGDKVWEDRKENVHKDGKDGKSKHNKSFDPTKSEFDDSKGRNDLNGGTQDPPTNKVSLKTAVHEQSGAKAPYRTEQAFSGGKKKSKGSKSNGNLATEYSKERLALVSSAALKEKKRSSSDSSSKNKLDYSKMRRESGKMREHSRNFFGDVKMEQAVNSLELRSKDGIKNPKLEVTVKENTQFADKSKERSSSKKNDNQVTSAAYPMVAPAVAPTTENGTVSDVAPVAPLVLLENWVACDGCQTWRLLPYGTDPDTLPKKWVCKMLNWLPGMNRCSFSEEETTKALYLLYQNPVPESQNTLHSQPNGAASGVNLPGVQHVDLLNQDPNLHGVPGVKKKHGLKETSNISGHMGSTHLPNSTKRNQQSSMKSRSLNDVIQSPSLSNLGNKTGVHHASRSGDSAVEKHGHKQKEKHKLAPDEGNAGRSKTKIKREADQDEYRASKKIKKGGLSNAEAEWNSDIDGIMGKGSLNGFSGPVVGKDVKNYVGYSKDPTYDAKENLSSFGKKPKDTAKVSLERRAVDVGKIDVKDIATKKRKAKEWQESEIYPSDTLADTANLEANTVSLKERTSESEPQKEKKARVSKSEGKESCKSKGNNVTTDRNERAARVVISSSKTFVADEMGNDGGYIEKDQQLRRNRGSTGSQRVLDGVESLKRDSGYRHPSVAATSSSSKVSGSRKSKGNFHETKGSPVESVCSSPLRILNPEKSSSTRRFLSGKDDAANVFSVVGSPRRCSDGEGDGGSDRSGTVRKVKASSAVNRGSLESSVLDYPDRDANHTPGAKAKAHNEPSRYQFESPHVVNGGPDTLDQCNKNGELGDKGHDREMERLNNHNGSSWKSGKGNSSRSKDKQNSFLSDLDKGKFKVSDSFNGQEDLGPTENSRNGADIESQDLLHNHKDQRDGVYTSQEKYGVKSGKEDQNYFGKKNLAGKWSSEGRIDNQTKYGSQTGSDENFDAACSKDGKSNPQQNLSERSSHRSLLDRTDQLEIASIRGKSKLSSHTGDKQEIQTRCPVPMPNTHKGSGSDSLPNGSSAGGSDDAPKVTRLPRKPDNKAGTYHNNSRHSTSNGVMGDLGGPSPLRKDSLSQAGATALKDARHLKHTADRLKNSGSDDDTTALYFEAALKFLNGASLLEPCNTESAKHGENLIQVYSSTASLCEFVAHDYERRKEMAAAALAYKCMEVAYMRVIYFKHSSAQKDRLELQAALQMVPPGESPSSSASDVDNLNNQGTLDKVALTKGFGSPHVGGNHVIVARHRPNFERLLTFAQDANFAMEASRKSLNAFAAATASLEETQCEGISSIKKVLDFNFHDVQGLLRLVRLAMDAISR